MKYLFALVACIAFAVPALAEDQPAKVRNTQQIVEFTASGAKIREYRGSYYYYNYRYRPRLFSRLRGGYRYYRR